MVAAHMQVVVGSAAIPSACTVTDPNLTLFANEWLVTSTRGSLELCGSLREPQAGLVNSKTYGVHGLG